jgi:hypothetical protein
MEVLLGSLLTLITIAVVSKRFNDSTKNTKLSLRVDMTQSKKMDLMKTTNMFADMVKYVEKLNSGPRTQSQKHFDSLHIKVVIAHNEAYWIANNIFYVADIDTESRQVLQETARAVDTMTMDDVQLKKIEEIVELLRKGENDSRSTGNEEF